MEYIILEFIIVRIFEVIQCLSSLQKFLYTLVLDRCLLIRLEQLLGLQNLLLIFQLPPWNVILIYEGHYRVSDAFNIIPTTLSVFLQSIYRPKRWCALKTISTQGFVLSILSELHDNAIIEQFHNFILNSKVVRLHVLVDKANFMKFFDGIQHLHSNLNFSQSLILRFLQIFFNRVFNILQFQHLTLAKVAISIEFREMLVLRMLIDEFKVVCLFRY